MNRTIYRDFVVRLRLDDGRDDALRRLRASRRGRLSGLREPAHLPGATARRPPARYRVGYIFTGNDYENKSAVRRLARLGRALPAVDGLAGLRPDQRLPHGGHAITCASPAAATTATPRPPAGTIYKGGGLRDALEVHVRVERLDGFGPASARRLARGAHGSDHKTRPPRSMGREWLAPATAGSAPRRLRASAGGCAEAGSGCALLRIPCFVVDGRWDRGQRDTHRSGKGVSRSNDRARRTRPNPFYPRWIAIPSRSTNPNDPSTVGPATTFDEAAAQSISKRSCLPRPPSSHDPSPHPASARRERGDAK
jgi:hypothetical protein